MNFRLVDSKMEVIGGVKKSSGGDGGKIIPDSVMDAVNRTSKNIEDVRAHFDEFLSVCDADVLAQLDPLERAQSLLLLAKVTTNLFACMHAYFSTLIPPQKFFFFLAFFIFWLSEFMILIFW